MSTNDYSIAFSEVLDVLQHSEIEVIERIPLEIIKKIKEKSDKEYQSKMQDNSNVTISQKAKAILAVIYQDYLCDCDELEEFNRQLWENEVKYQETLRKKYNTDNIFKDKKELEETTCNSENMQMLEYKESVFKKVLNKIKMLFKRIV